jgi:hypothetical protein
MFNKKRLIIAVVLVVATVAIFATVATVAYILFLRPSGDTEAMPGATAVGVPNGPATTKSIGPAGGSIASPDGRITVAVPPNALPGPVDFSIQPITNLASGGLGNAYRLEPGGHNFATPVKVSLKLDDQDLTASPAIAYQDPTGVWQAFKTADIDQAGKTISVSTTHFTDFAGVTYKLIPEKATVKVGGTLQIKLVGCREEDSFLNTVQKLFTAPHQECSLTTAQNPQWSADFGKLAVSGAGATYTAPAKKPPYGVDEVVLKFNYGSFVGREVSKITIVDWGYTATGSDVTGGGPMSYSGTICDLAKSFTVIGHEGPLTVTFTFTPSGDGRTGTGTISGVVRGIAWSGGRPYKIEGFDGDKPRIILEAAVTVSGPPGTGTKPFTHHIDLVPGSSECTKK